MLIWCLVLAGLASKHVEQLPDKKQRQEMTTATQSAYTASLDSVGRMKKKSELTTTSLNPRYKFPLFFLY